MKLVSIVVLLLSLISPNVYANKKAVLDVNTGNIAALLKRLSGKRVAIMSAGGGRVAGTVDDASAQWVRIVPATPNEGQEVLISLGAIIGVTYFAGPLE